MSLPLVSPDFFAVDASGVPLVGGKLYTYAAGTTTPLSTYTTSALDTPNANPVVLNSNGRASVFLSPDTSYRLVLKSADESITYRDQDDVLAGSDIADSLADSSSATTGAGLVAYDGTKSYAVKTVGRALATRVNVMDWIDSSLWAAIENGTSTTDVYSYIQSCVTAKPTKDIWVPAGLYRFTRGFYLKTGQAIVGETGTTFKALPASWVGTTGPTGTAPFIWNYTNGTTTITDADISVENITFDYDTVVVSGGGAHAVRFRAVNRPRVINSRFYNGENGTAMLACKDSLVDECEAYNVTNCFFDHWDGCIGGTVRNCIGRNDAGIYIAQGIQFTGTGSLLEDRNSYDFLATGNRLYGVRGATGQSSAIIFNTNDTGSTATRCKSVDNYVEDSDNGIVFQGPTGQHLSVNDTFRNVTKLPIFLQDDGTGSPSDCRVINPTLIDCNHLAANIAMVSIAGTDNIVSGIRVVNTGTPGYEAIARLVSTSVGCAVDIEWGANGTVARVLNESTTGWVRDNGGGDYWPKQIPTVASASTIAPTPGVSYVSGTTTINTITVPHAFRACGGRLTFIPTAIWALGTSGNIQIAATAVVSRAMDLIWDPNANKWFPSYV